MDKHISHISHQTGTRQTIPASSGKTAKLYSDMPSFEKLLNKQKQTTATEPLLVGEISSRQKTVSELLIQHPDFKESTWNILASEQNRNKDYTKLPIGTRIYYHADQKSLSWETPGQKEQATTKLTTELSRAPVTQLYPVNHLTVDQLQNGEKKSQSALTSPLPLGRISETRPTISHLLKADPSLGPDAWNILSAPVNKEKDFKTIPLGATVQFDPETREITWNVATQKIVQQTSHIDSETNTASTNAAEQLTLLGKIDRDNPTVSHLLSRQPELKDRIWQILSNSANKDKPFQQIANGTSIYLQPDSDEIHWLNHSGQSPSSASTPVFLSSSGVEKIHTDEPASDLTEAVQPFLGSSYKDINCYELLVKGLDRMDIPYGGKNGLYTKLQSMALNKGLPANAYLNGEGIVKAAGSTVFSKNFPSSSNWQKQSAALFEEIEPLLDKGQILSFSTRRRGHTGIISQQDKQWTFINSGRLDNSLGSNKLTKGVGEEDLHKELTNWFKLAHKNKETLMVTLGQLEQQKVAAAYTMGESIAKRI